MEAGIRGVSPGPDTERYLARREMELRALGGTSVGLLAVAAYLFDRWTAHVLGVALGTPNLLLLVGLVASANRQVNLYALGRVQALFLFADTLYLVSP